MTTSRGDLVVEVPTCYGQLSIDGVSMHRLAWQIPDLSDLWKSPEIRGGDRLLPGVVGVKPYRRRKTVTRYSLPLLVNGHWDRFDVEVADPDGQLAVNMRYLLDVVALPTNVGDGTRPATVTWPDGEETTADVHVLGIPAGQLLPNAVLRTTLELSVPGGDLHI